MTNYAAIYQPIADNAAYNHGIPSTLFSRLIAQVSGFDPTVNGGIAGLPDGAGTNVEPATALNMAAKYLGDSYGAGNTWRDAVASYLGVDPNTDTVSKIVGTFDPAQQKTLDELKLQNAAESIFPVSKSSVLSWGLQDWKNFFLDYSSNILIFSVGFLLIIFALYALVMKGNRQIVNVVSTIKKGA